VTRVVAPASTDPGATKPQRSLIAVAKEWQALDSQVRTKHSEDSRTELRRHLQPKERLPNSFMELIQRAPPCGSSPRSKRCKKTAEKRRRQPELEESAAPE
jgi:hypothetical protein